MRLKMFGFGILVFSVIGFLFWYFYLQSKPSSPPGLIYNTITQQGEEATNSDPHVTRDDVVRGDNTTGLDNFTLLKGYFDSYEESSKTLTIKSIMPFTNNNKFELVNLQLNPSQAIYCVPKYYTDPNTGKTYLTKAITVPVKDNEVLFFPGEKPIPINEFLTRSNDLTYLMIQLTNDFDKETTNYVKKLIVTGLCE